MLNVGGWLNQWIIQDSRKKKTNNNHSNSEKQNVQNKVGTTSTLQHSQSPDSVAESRRHPRRLRRCLEEKQKHPLLSFSESLCCFFFVVC